MSDTTTGQGAHWVPCPCCDCWWCVRHGAHAHDCPCPEAGPDDDPYAMETTMTATFGQKLAARRQAAGLTQEQLAERSGIHRVMIARYEAGSPGRGTQGPTLGTLRKLAAALGCTVDDLT